MCYPCSRSRCFLGLMIWASWQLRTRYHNFFIFLFIFYIFCKQCHFNMLLFLFFSKVWSLQLHLGYSFQINFSVACKLGFLFFHLNYVLTIYWWLRDNSCFFFFVMVSLHSWKSVMVAWSVLSNICFRVNWILFWIKLITFQRGGCILEAMTPLIPLSVKWVCVVRAFMECYGLHPILFAYQLILLNFFFCLSQPCHEKKFSAASFPLFWNLCSKLYSCPANFFLSPPKLSIFSGHFHSPVQSYLIFKHLFQNTWTLLFQ